MLPRMILAAIATGLSAVWLWMLLICASTVFIKQHSIVDVYAACALFVPIYFAVYFIWKTKEEAA